MANQVILILLALIMISKAFGADPDLWRKDLNNNFEVTCGDNVAKVPYDQNDMDGVMLPFSKGQATKLPQSEMGGYWTDGIGYKVNLATTSPEIFGTSEPIKAVLNCYFKEESIDMTCYSDLEFDSVKTVHGFNSFMVKLPIPRKNMVSGSAEFTVRRSEKMSTDKYHGFRYFKSSREATCKYKAN
jgi:hypothetical protein